MPRAAALCATLCLLLGLGSSGALPSLTSPFFVSTLAVEGVSGYLAYDQSQGIAFFENDTTDNATVWQVASISQKLACYWYSPSSSAPCYCEPLPSWSFGSVFWQALAQVGTFGGDPCYSGSFLVHNNDLIDQICFPSGSTSPSYLGISNGGEEVYLQVGTFNRAPSAQLFDVRRNCN